MGAARAASAVLVVLALALSGVAPSGAAPTRRTSPAPQPDLFGGYSYTHAGEADLHGWALAGSHPLRGGQLRLVGDVSGHYGSYAGADVGQFAAFLGARWRFSANDLRPFVEGLVGAARTGFDVAGVSDADVDWGLALGGGADYALGERWAVRGLVHLRLLHGEGAWDADPRLAVGAVYRFGQ